MAAKPNKAVAGLSWPRASNLDSAIACADACFVIVSEAGMLIGAWQIGPR